MKYFGVGRSKIKMFMYCAGFIDLYYFSLLFVFARYYIIISGALEALRKYNKGNDKFFIFFTKMADS